MQLVLCHKKVLEFLFEWMEHLLLMMLFLHDLFMLKLKHFSDKLVRMLVFKAKFCKEPRMFMMWSMCDFCKLPVAMELSKLLAHTYQREWERRPLLLERAFEQLL